MNKKYIYMGVAAIVAVALLASAFLLFKGLGELNEAKGRLDRGLDQMARFYKKNPFPSPQNVVKEKKNVEKLNGWYQELAKAFARKQIEPVRKTPSTFMRELGETELRVERRAQKLGARLGEGFKMGFESYFGSGSTLPAPDDVARLAQQLMISERLCNILLDERASALLTVERQRFESSKTPRESTARTVTRRPALRRPARSSKPESTATLPVAPDAGLIGEDDLFGRMSFIIEFEAFEESIWRVIERLAADEMFAVVQSMEIEKTQPDVKAIDSGTPVTPLVGAEPEGKVAARPKLGASRRQRLMSGREVSSPMNVIMRIDVYRFKTAESEDES